MGLTLKNPLIVGSCNLSMEPDAAKKMEDAGASAIVFKSLFEEQVNLESMQMEEELSEYAERNAEMVSLFPSLKHAGPQEHLDQLARIVKAVDIPVIGSLNCVQPETWVDYAKEMEGTGVAGLELNFYATPVDKMKTAQELEASQVQVLEQVVKAVGIPVSVKLSPFYSNVLEVVGRMEKAGAAGFVLFNRLFQPDIDINKQAHHFPFYLSHPGDYRLSLRYAGLLYKEMDAGICANTGVFSGEDMAKMILGGADCVQVVSALYKHKISHIKVMLTQLNDWMEARGYASLGEFHGKLSRKELKDPYAYKRAQYVDLLMKPFEVMKKYPQV